MRGICFACAVLACGSIGCGHFEIFKGKASVTAVPLSAWNQNEPHGIPYYLPKPLLVIAKNVRHVDSSKPGLTYPAPIPGGFDNQASYADIKANISMPAGGGTQATAEATALSGATSEESQLPDIKEQILADTQLKDGLTPDVYYTYQVIFVPDLSQKYGLRIKGGPGEIRAAMNLLNGWMYTGMGPYYMKDSSTAQNMMACGVGTMFAGRGVADVLGEVNNFQKAAGKSEGAEFDEDRVAMLADAYTRMLEASRKEQCLDVIPNYAEVVIYEPVLTDCGQTEWRLVAQHSFDRQYFRSGPADAQVHEIMKSIMGAASSAPSVSQAPQAEGTLFEDATRQQLGLVTSGGREESAALDNVGSPGVVAIQQNAPCCEPAPAAKRLCFPSLFRKDREPPKMESRLNILSEGMHYGSQPQRREPETVLDESTTGGSVGTGAGEAAELKMQPPTTTTTLEAGAKLTLEGLPTPPEEIKTNPEIPQP